MCCVCHGGSSHEDGRHNVTEGVVKQAGLLFTPRLAARSIALLTPLYGPDRYRGLGLGTPRSNSLASR